MIIVTLGVLGGILSMIWKIAAPPPNANHNRNDRDQNDNNDQNEVPRRRMRVRQNRRRAIQDQQNNDLNLDDDEENENGEEDADNRPTHSNDTTRLQSMKPIGKKKAQKLEEKALRRQRHEYLKEEQAKRRERDRVDMEESMARRQKEREEEAEQERLLAIEKQQQEEEYQRWAAMMELQESGDAVEEQQKQEERLAALLEQIQGERSGRTMPVQALAEEFGLETAVVVERLQRLQRSGDVPGILTDRGMYTALRKEDLVRLGEEVQKRGRISLKDAGQVYMQIIQNV